MSLENVASRKIQLHDLPPDMLSEIGAKLDRKALPPFPFRATSKALRTVANDVQPHAKITKASDLKTILNRFPPIESFSPPISHLDG